MRILCLDIPAPGASLEKYAPHLNAEALHAWGLYKSGFIRDIYFLLVSNICHSPFRKFMLAEWLAAMFLLICGKKE